MHPDEMAVSDHILSLLKRGERLLAMKTYKDEKGCSLLEAKFYIDELEEEVRRAALREQHAIRQSALSDTQPDGEVLRLIRQGQKLAAVKVFKDQTGCDLKWAKDYIDELYEQIGPKPEERPTSSYKEWSASLASFPPASAPIPTRHATQKRKPMETERPTPPPPASTGDHYDKGEPQGCLGVLLLPLLTLLSYYLIA